MNFIFNTASVLIAGMVFVIIYFVVFGFQRRLRDAKFAQFGTVFILPLAIFSNIELIYRTMMLLNENLLERDKMVTVVGAFTLLFLSFKSFLTILTVTKTSTVQQE